MMKNNEIIKVAALVVLTAALLYRKYKKKKTGRPDKDKNARQIDLLITFMQMMIMNRIQKRTAKNSSLS